MPFSIAIALIDRMQPMAEAVGWTSSVILLATIGKQVHKQWSERSSAGVSKWLLIGQVAASIGFTVYSWMLHSWVFVITNLLMLVNAMMGLVVLLHQRRARRSAGRVSAQSGSGFADTRAGKG